MNPPSSPGTYGPGERAEAGRSPAAERDLTLIRRMANGEESALGELYDQWVTLVHSLAAHLLRDQDEAEEVVEETFWQAWRQAGRYDASRGAVSTWLTTIARSRALDRLRARRRVREEPWSRLALDGEADRIAPAEAGTADPLTAAEMAERRALVRNALGRLPAEQREVLELAYFGGLSQSEIAERTGLPLGTVKTRARLALEKLRDRLSMLNEGAPGGTR
ncbi:MAG TPA: sigma-70 family RNA polymerase sigma factor [Gemmatimonadaceae bacterium]|nr:sigma-70 family RNA polymerase sigma factor [Gemmatimonadaceae bacterium]